MSRRRSFWLSVCLTLPVLFFVLHHYFFHSPELHPTGFTNNENVLYMSYAHQYLDQPGSIAYSNPFDGDPAAAKIYFQPVNFLFAALMKAGVDPGLAFSIFGLLMAFIAIYLGTRLIQHLLPGNRHLNLIILLFTWGGGLTALAGLGSAAITHPSLEHWSDGIYLADPAAGWWALNWGRNLFIPLEAWYHVLFLLNIYLVLKKRWTAATLATLFLSLSHPFTGIEYLLILTGWIALEKIVFKNRNIPYWFGGALVGVLALHAGYYLFYLDRFAEHRQLFSQYSAGWTYSFRVFIPAYAIVFLIAVCTVYYRQKSWLADPQQRLFLCWAVSAFLLSKHEWFLKPMQPIHFTRGYVWAGLFLFGLPALVRWLDYWKGNTRNWLLRLSFIGLFLLDNTCWIAKELTGYEKTEWEGYLKKDTKDLFSFLHSNTTPTDLLIGDINLVNYMANVYTPANAWVSHPYNTPQREARLAQMHTYMETGNKPAAWEGRRILLVVNRHFMPVNLSPGIQAKRLYENGTYIVFTP